MHPRLFEIPIIHWPVGAYGPMLVLGFLAAITLIRYLNKDIGKDPQHIINVALYSLIGGVIGARVFYVIHYFDKFKNNLPGIFQTWNGGLELLGGVIAAIVIILVYLKYYKLPILNYIDVLAIGLMLGIGFGRVGCFLNGCCYGKPADVPWAVRFPSYVNNFNEKSKIPSFVFDSQVHPCYYRDRIEPHLKLPRDYFYAFDEDGYGYLKPFDELSEQQRFEVTKGQYRCLPVHPTQLYTSLGAAFSTLLLFLFWRRSRKSKSKFLTGPGCTFSLMFVLYGTMRFIIEMLRDDNPFEYGWWAIYKGGTVSQNISIYMIIIGVAFLITFQVINSKKARNTK
ncbi:MAG: prolipoprotein diacylglyceryl transferase [Sedimentisphaerales bacterium]|nr:prolipoprotein diacylglyceryl transferase [Sedimentisphaerales bacterium]